MTRASPNTPIHRTRFNFPPLPSSVFIDLSDDEDFVSGTLSDTATQHSNRTTGGPCYIDRFRDFRDHDPPDTMFVYDSHSDRVFDTRSGLYVDEAFPSPKRYVLIFIFASGFESLLKVDLYSQRRS